MNVENEIIADKESACQVALHHTFASKLKSRRMLAAFISR